jgi:hypothetical protein
MDMKSKFDAFRAATSELISAVLFTAVIVAVVGGTTAMLLERSAIYA